MNVFEETFVIIHIRLSGLRLYIIKARTLVTVLLILFLIFSLFQIYSLLFLESFTITSFLQDIVYLFGVAYISLLWVKSWPKANKHLNGVSMRDHDTKDKNDT